MATFARRNLEEYTDSLAAYLPGGELFASRSIQDSNFRKLLRGMAGELFRTNGYLREYAGGVIPDQTEKFLDEWESTLGIPDGCFPGTGTNDERRRDILIKLASLGVQTAADFVAVADLFGITVEVTPGVVHALFPVTFPIVFTGGVDEARFTIIVKFTVDAGSRFPFTFPFTFGDASIAVLECLFRRLKPANCDIIFLQV